MDEGSRVVIDTKRDHGLERIRGRIQNATLTFESRDDGVKQRLRPDVLCYYTNLRIMEDPPVYGYGTLDLIDSTNLVDQQLVTPIEIITDVGLRPTCPAQEIKMLNFDESAAAPTDSIRIAAVRSAATSAGPDPALARRKRAPTAKAEAARTKTRAAGTKLRLISARQKRKRSTT